jgi:lantibiotic modifying enzyme
VSAERDRFLDAATRIGRRLCRDAIWWEGRCSWMGWAIEPHGGQWAAVHRAMGPLVYDGTAGIGLFLARLAPLAGDRIIGATATGALAQALSAADSLSSAGEYGFYSGLSGIAWCGIEGGRTLANDELVTRGQAVMARVAQSEPTSQRLDLLNGSAGLIAALLAAADHQAGEELLQAAERHGEHLMKLAARTEQGWSWETMGVPDQPHLLGFGHGASGIAYALAALGVARGRGDFVSAAREALRYERAHFRATEGNWPDLRSFAQAGPTGEPPCMVAWCHGAPGIGFARLALHELMPGEPSNLAEAEIAIRTTAATLGQAAQGMGNFSLCHGDGGNADLLVLGADVLDRPELRRHAEAAGARALDRFEDAKMPWPCGVVGAGETPNLLLGLAGIGYFFLRLYDSRKIPTALLPGARGRSAATAGERKRRTARGRAPRDRHSGPRRRREPGLRPPGPDSE